MSFVLLPKGFNGLLHQHTPICTDANPQLKDITGDCHERVYLFDSFPTYRTLPDHLQHLLTAGGSRMREIEDKSTIVQNFSRILSPNATIRFNSQKSLQLSGDNSCGFWAIFAAIITVLEGNDTSWQNLPSSLMINVNCKLDYTFVGCLVLLPIKYSIKLSILPKSLRSKQHLV